MRITGLATGLDMDQIIKDSMKPYRMKIDQTKQKQEIVQIKQQLYRDVIKDSREFYDKYFDVSKPDSLLLSSNWSTTKFTSSDDSVVDVKGVAGSKPDNYKVTVEQVAKKASHTISLDDLGNMKSFTLEIGGETITIGNITDAEKDDPKKLAERVNSKLQDKKIDLTVSYSEFSGGLVIESNNTGKENKFEISYKYKADAEGVEEIKKFDPVEGEDCIAKIINSKGDIQEYTGSSNRVVFDGVEFTFNDVSKDEIRITGKTDTTGTKDKLVTFINDYNTIIETLNKMVMEKPNKSYQPLTEEQKKEMSESEIKLWNEKVKQGQLSRDSDLTRVVNSMKSAMSSVMGNLEKIGISPVADYQGTKNGTLKIDEAKLDKALENNPEEVMNLFIGNSKDADGKEVKGIMHKLKDTLYNEVVTVTSPLIKKAGIDNSATSSNNELTRSIEKYNKKLADMEKDFARREQALYSKYARLEVAMNKYNSQQGMLMQNVG